MVIPSDMPKEYKDYGYWTVPYFLHKAAAIGPQTRMVIDNVVKRFDYPVQSFRSCFGIIKLANRHGKEALERCCQDALLRGRCNYTYIANTIASYKVEGSDSHKEPSEEADSLTGVFKDDDSRYSLRNLLQKQEEGGAQ